MMAEAAGPREVAEKEQEIIDRLKEVFEALEQVSEVEDRFFQNARSGEHPNKLRNNVKDFRIYLRDDIQPVLQEIDSEIEQLRQELERSEPETLLEVFDRIEKAVGLMEKEEVRLAKILERAQEALEEEEVDPQEVAKGLDEFERSEESQVLEEIQTELAYSNTRLDQLAEA